MQVRLDCYKNMQILIVKFMILSCKIESNQNDICYDNDSVFLLYSHYFHCYCIFFINIAVVIFIIIVNVKCICCNFSLRYDECRHYNHNYIFTVIIVTTAVIIASNDMFFFMMIIIPVSDTRKNGLVNLFPYSKRMFNCHFIDETSPNVLLGGIDAACNS